MRIDKTLVYTVGSTIPRKENDILHMGNVPWMKKWKTFPSLDRILFEREGRGCALVSKKSKKEVRKAKALLEDFQIQKMQSGDKGHMMFGPCKKSLRNKLYRYVTDEFNDTWEDEHRILDKELQKIYILGVARTRCCKPRPNGERRLFVPLYLLQVAEISTFAAAYHNHKDYRYTAIPFKPMKDVDESEFPYKHLEIVDDETMKNTLDKSFYQVKEDVYSNLEKIRKNARHAYAPWLYDRDGERDFKIPVVHDEDEIYRDLGRDYKDMEGFEDQGRRLLAHDLCIIGTEKSQYFACQDNAIDDQMPEDIKGQAIGRALKEIHGESMCNILEELGF